MLKHREDGLAKARKTRKTKKSIVGGETHAVQQTQKSSEVCVVHHSRKRQTDNRQRQHNGQQYILYGSNILSEFF